MKKIEPLTIKDIEEMGQLLGWDELDASVKKWAPSVSKNHYCPCCGLKHSDTSRVVETTDEVQS